MKYRSRILRPGFFTNELLAEVDPFARLLFEGLWLLADREGRMEDRPAKIKILILPYDNVDIDSLLGQLAERGFIIRYKVDSYFYIQVVNFKIHQQVYHKEADSVIPEFNNKAEAYLKLSGSYPVATNKNKHKKEHKQKHKKEKEHKQKHKDIIELILSDLNEKSGRNYKYCDSNIDIIDPRLEEGRTLEDFLHINTVKCQEWLTTQQEKYIRPETLYSKKHFESYLNQPLPDKVLSKFSEKTQQTIQNMKEILEGDRQDAITGKG